RRRQAARRATSASARREKRGGEEGRHRQGLGGRDGKQVSHQMRSRPQDRHPRERRDPNHLMPPFVISAEAEIHFDVIRRTTWIPAYAGMTNVVVTGAKTDEA